MMWSHLVGNGSIFWRPGASRLKWRNGFSSLLSEHIVLRRICQRSWTGHSHSWRRMHPGRLREGPAGDGEWSHSYYYKIPCAWQLLWSGESSLPKIPNTFVGVVGCYKPPEYFHTAAPMLVWWADPRFLLKSPFVKSQQTMIQWNNHETQFNAFVSSMTTNNHKYLIHRTKLSSVGIKLPF